MQITHIGITADAPIALMQDARIQEQVAIVKSYISKVVKNRNLYGWRSYIQELQSDMELYIYSTELAWREGRAKTHLGTGAYCRKAFQLAMNYAESCSTQRRRANYETTPIEYHTDDLVLDDVSDRINLLVSLEQSLGKDVAALAQTVLNGEKLTIRERNQLRKYEKQLLPLLQG